MHAPPTAGPGRRQPNVSSAPRTLLAALLAGMAAAAAPLARAGAQGCWIGLPAAAGAVTIDGNVTNAAEWQNASVAQSNDGCLEPLVDHNGAYFQGGVRLFGQRNATSVFLRLDVDDLSRNLAQNSLGERIIIQINPDHGQTATMETGPGANFEYRLDVSHRWVPGAGGAPEIELGAPQFFSSSQGPAPAPGCQKQRWASAAPAGTIEQKARELPGTGYRIEIRMDFTALGTTEAGVLGNTNSALGIAVAVVNDMAHQVSGQNAYSAAAFPSNLHFTSNVNGVLDPNTNSNPIGCGDWLVPSKWGHAYLQTAPGDVTISREPVAWNSNAIQLFHCDYTAGNQGYDYWPKHPCTIGVRATVKNTGGAPATRNILYLWGSRDAASVKWTFMDMQKNVTVAPNPPLDVDAAVFKLPAVTWNKPEHPCMRVYILPTSFQGGFDEARIRNMLDAADSELNLLMSVYGLTDANWTQKNINRVSNTTQNCPYGCLSLFGREADLALLAAGAAGAPAAVGEALGLFPRPLYAQDRPPTPRPDSAGRRIYLSASDLRRYGDSDAVVQVQSFGYLQAPNAPYHFIEPVGGAIELIPYDRIRQEGTVAVSFAFTNGTSVAQTLIPEVAVRLPTGVQDIAITLDRRPFTVEPGKTTVVRASAALVRKCGCLDFRCRSQARRDSAAAAGVRVGMAGGGGFGAAGLLFAGALAHWPRRRRRR